MLKYNTIIAEAEILAEKRQLVPVLMKLRELSVDEFGLLLTNLPTEYPNLSSILPVMAPEIVQKNWTGNAGIPLLQQSIAFMRSVDAGCKKYTNSGLGGKILDYGCGWGRLLRLALYYSDPAQLYGIDPWDESIKLCEQAMLPANLSLCDYLPNELPFSQVQFDYIYSFSVFTHLSERAAQSVLDACAGRIRENGLLVITVRPEHYWQCESDKNIAQSMIRSHKTRGFAFNPHNRAAIDGDITYGDTSISLNYIDKSWTQWKIVGYDYNCVDGLQVILFLQLR